MFTGLISHLGNVKSIELNKESAKLVITNPAITKEIKVGDSIAVNGVCLTATEFDSEGFTVDVMVQTLNLTSTGKLKVGDLVNLELATKSSDRLGGHIVQGHVDTTATLVEHRPDGPWAFLKFELDPAWTRLMVPKGSIAVDGVSLTVVDTGPGWFTNMLIPHTLAVTTLGTRNIGEPVNIETDILAKHVQRLLETATS